MAVAVAAWTGEPANLFSKRPYLQAPGSTHMTVFWESAENLPARVRYGEGQRRDHVQEASVQRMMQGVSTRSRTNVVAGGRTNVTSYTVTNTFYVYEATLRDLRPATRYSYTVDLGPQTSPVRTFHTFGQSPARVRFAAYGDSRTRPEVHTVVARQIRKRRPEFILHTGDLVTRGRDYSLWGREFFTPLADVIDHVPLLPAIGNHEENGTNYFAYFRLPPPERWYAFDLGPVHVLALDYHFEQASAAQFAFAQRDLRDSHAPWKIVFLHYPLFNVGGHGTTWGQDAYLPLFHETHVDLVIGGHSHVYERFRPVRPGGAAGEGSPIVCLTTGGGGAPLYPIYDHPALASKASTNHFLVFEATPDRLKAKAYLTSGKVLDRFEIRKSGGRPAADWMAQTYPEEWLRTYFEAAPVLRGRVAALPQTNKSVVVEFTLRPLTNAAGPVTLELQVAPDSAPHYDWVGPPLRVSLPAVGEPARAVWAEVRATGRKAVTGKAGQELSPYLVFQARLQAGELDVVARGARSTLAISKAPTGETALRPVEFEGTALVASQRCREHSYEDQTAQRD